MDDSEDLCSDAQKRALLEKARRQFPTFYRSATPADMKLMDDLVLAHVDLVAGINASRHVLPSILRDALEKTCDKTERVFTELREAVRASPSFAGLPDDERKRIEDVVLDVPPPSTS